MRVLLDDVIGSMRAGIDIANPRRQALVEMDLFAMFIGNTDKVWNGRLKIESLGKVQAYQNECTILLTLKIEF